MLAAANILIDSTSTLCCLTQNVHLRESWTRAAQILDAGLWAVLFFLCLCTSFFWFSCKDRLEHLSLHLSTNTTEQKQHWWRFQDFKCLSWWHLHYSLTNVILLEASELPQETEPACLSPGTCSPPTHQGHKTLIWSAVFALNCWLACEERRLLAQTID